MTQVHNTASTTQRATPSPEKTLPAVALTEKEAARYITMSTSYLRKARIDGDLQHRTPGPPFVKIGRAVRYLKADLDGWLAEHRVHRHGRLLR